jgi:hypothetical protein
LALRSFTVARRGRGSNRLPPYERADPALGGIVMLPESEKPPQKYLRRLLSFIEILSK